MKNWPFRKWNTILGWVMFGIALLIYFSTIEHGLSFWDCGEYISSAVKLEVTHAPGAALFQIIGAVAGMFAFGKGENYAIVINGLSALCSAFTILFLFWTITDFFKRAIYKNDLDESPAKQISVFAAGIIGSLAFTFSDSFWFSAVEGEVYAMASMFIALLVWLITKWENQANEPGNERWIILIFFVTGLSVGVHMMCMLAIPCICLIYYARKYEFTWKNFIIANVITLIILAMVFKIVFPVIMGLFGKLEIFAVNGIGLPFHSGTVLAFLILIAACYLLIKWTSANKRNLVKTAGLSLVFMIIGFSCWMVIPIRANANPPMNLNNPDTAIGMLDYYNRVQYGDWPTIYGQNYTAYLDANGMLKNEDRSFKKKITGNVYEKNEKTGKYDIVDQRFDYVYNPEHVSFMPRMFNENKEVMSNYISMEGAPDFTLNYDNEEIANSEEAQQVFDELHKKWENGAIKVDDYLEAREYNLLKVHRPTLGQNLNYFFTFQNGYYFVRYLFWNFVGRQNNMEGHMENTNGNWISGISFIDDYQYGNQKDLPAKFKNESTVAFYFLPLLLGLIGFVFQVNKDFGRFYALLSLFLLTSVGIIFYTGVKPFEPRERDYALVGSFYAFAIWIGIGAGALIYLIQKKVKNNAVSLILAVLLAGIPIMMGFQNYRPHDRSKKTAARDYSFSMLNSLPKNDILFVYADNDTYPVWGLQETERVRDDVKVVNFTLLATPWNIDQVLRRTYNSMPMPSSLKHDDYRDGTNDQIYVMSPDVWQNIFANMKENGVPDQLLAPLRPYLVKDSMTVQEAMRFLKSKSPAKDEVLKAIFGEDAYQKFNFVPCSRLVIPVNKQNAIASGIIKPEDAAQAVDYITVDYKAATMYKSNLMMMDLLANFDWKRPINFSSAGIYDAEQIFYLKDYLQADGFSYRLVPIKTEENDFGDIGRVDANSLYNTVKGFRWGNFKDLRNHYDETATSNIFMYRLSASRAASELALQGQKAKATELLDLVSREIPVSKYNDAQSMSTIANAYILAGQEQKGLKMADEIKKNIFREYDYYTSLPAEQQKYLGGQLGRKPAEYTLVVKSVVAAYEKLGQKDKAYAYLVSSIDTIDKRFKAFVANLRSLGKEKAYEEADKVQKITPFYEYLFDVMKPYDTGYAAEKQHEITDAIIHATE